MWIIEIFKMSVDTSCDVLVYMTILWIVDFCIHEWINEMSILEFFVLWMDYFDTLWCIYSGSHWNHLEAKKIFISKQVYVVNLHPIVMTPPFGETLLRYMDVANRLVASPALPIDTKTTFDAVSVARCCTESISTSTLPVPSAVFLLPENVGAATDRLVTSLYRNVSPRKALGRGYRHIHFPK